MGLESTGSWIQSREIQELNRYVELVLISDVDPWRIQYNFSSKKNDVKSKYNIGINNCKHLAKRIFDRFAKRKYHEIGRGSATNGYDISMDMTNLVPRELNLVSDKYKQYTSYSATHGGYLIFTELTLRLHHIAFVALLIAESQMVLGLQHGAPTKKEGKTLPVLAFRDEHNNTKTKPQA